MPAVYAHSLPDAPEAEWETLGAHSTAVADAAAGFADAFGCAEIARVAGRLHDVGKVSPEVQAYLRGRGPSVDHSTAGARVAFETYGKALGRILALLVAGHHAGLPDHEALDRRLDARRHPIPGFAGWEPHVGALPPPKALSPTRSPPSRPKHNPGFAEAFLIRMLFSCLVDADFLETERFYAEAQARPVERGFAAGLETLAGRLERHMAAKAASAAPSPLNALRAEVLAHARAKAGDAPGLFTLTVPTGGGKTLASLSFALEHARRHGLRRVVYVIPFTSIIEQTAAVFRDALGEDAGILEHHASFDWDGAAKRGGAERDEGFGADASSRLRRAAENWDAPVVVTTAVQFFESLFANRTSRCRKLHNLANAVIVLDEAQTLPQRLLLPCMAALDELARTYRASVVLCTATQPALREKDGFAGGLAIGDDRELAPDPKGLYERLKRVRVERAGPTADDAIAQRFAAQPRMLCVVNSRAHARALFALIESLPGAVHLSTLMCPRHRRLVLEDARARLKAEGEPVRIVSTSLIEAGVDIDLPEVWRASAGLDSIIQAAGRANREGRGPEGRVVVFEPTEWSAPHDLRQAWEAGRRVLSRHADPLSLDAVREYFGEIYWQKGREALDAATLDGAPWRILPAIAERCRDLTFPFESIARAFRVIDTAMEPVIVPWKAHPGDEEAGAILRRVAAMDKPLGADLRRLQQYTVSIPARARSQWLAAGALRPVHAALGNALLRFEGLEHYDAETGLRLDDPAFRSAEANVM